MARVLITGAAGFLGSHLVDQFLSRSFDVIGMDNLLTGTTDNLDHIGSPHFHFISHDVAEYIFIKGPLDYVLHFASPASPADYARFPIQTLKVGAMGTHKALGLAREKRARFLLASTSEVYGDPLEHPQRETYFGNVDCVCVRGVYDEAKRYAEALTMAYHRTHALPTRIARIFNTYGPRMRLFDGRVLPSFMRQAFMGESLTVYGDGRQTRSFCHVSDLTEGIFRLLMSDEVYPVNLGNPDEMTVLELAHKVLAVTGSTSKIVRNPLPENDPKVRRPDITRARTLLSWSPRVSLDEGLASCLDYFRREVDRLKQRREADPEGGAPRKARTRAKRSPAARTHSRAELRSQARA